MSTICKQLIVHDVTTTIICQPYNVRQRITAVLLHWFGILSGFNKQWLVLTWLIKHIKNIKNAEWQQQDYEEIAMSKCILVHKKKPTRSHVRKYDHVIHMTNASRISLDNRAVTAKPFMRHCQPGTHYFIYSVYAKCIVCCVSRFYSNLFSNHVNSLLNIDRWETALLRPHTKECTE